MTEQLSRTDQKSTFCETHCSFCSFQVDFQDLEARTIAERRREEERQRKMERIYKARVEAAAKEMEGWNRLH